MNRRTLLLAGAAAVATTGQLSAQARGAAVEVYKSPTCGCCSGWIAHMRDAGFEVRALDVDQDTLWAMKARVGIIPELGSCHTALVDGYVVEGHVPAADVERLLDERPRARGLTVPGMPVGSPGMEMGDQREPYVTLLVLQDGATKVFQQHS